MQQHKTLNRALLIVGALILILGLTLAFTVPQELKDLTQVMKQKMLSGDWGPGKGGWEAGAWGRSWGHPFGGMHHGFFGLGHFIVLIGLVFLVGAVVVFAFRRAHGCHRFRREGDAVEILREKFASGEIGKDEYLARLKVLENDSEIE